MQSDKKNSNKRFNIVAGLFILVSLGVLLVIFLRTGGMAGAGADANSEKAHEASTYVMDTMVTQTIYGPNAPAAGQQVNAALAEYDQHLSLFSQEGDIAKINGAAGVGGADVSPQAAALLRRAVQLSAQSEGAFAITVAPLTLAWGITGENPRVVPQAELDALLPLVDDAAIQFDGDHVTLPQAGMGIDLGGIAKGAACAVAKEIYEENGVESALLSIGGNVYAHGTKPGGEPWRIGFRDPNNSQNSSIASFFLSDKVSAVSGGYERYFEQDGRRYIHILDPRTGKPAESDIVSVGVISADGAEADFYSTTLFVWGKKRALQYMREGGCAILLDNTGTLYVSESLRHGFELYEEAGSYQLEFVQGG